MAANITRFNPTTNGDMHLGHLLVVMFNEYAAHSTGGRFGVRMEDNQVDTLYTYGAAAVARSRNNMRETLEWLGIPVDDYSRQSDMDLAFKEFVAHHGWWIPEYRWPYDYALDATKQDYMEEPGGYLGDWFGYAPYLTFCRVVYDELQGINLLIRGEDLRSEFTLYQHFRAQMGLPAITHYYVPRLNEEDGTIVSKFFRAKPVLDFKAEGWSPADVIGALANSVLLDPGQGWKMGNARPYPRLGTAFSAAVRDYDPTGSNSAHGTVRNYQSFVYPAR